MRRLTHISIGIFSESFTLCKMSQFIGYVKEQYIYTRDGKEFAIPSGLLNSLFKTHGYCVDPGAYQGAALPSQNVNQLRALALSNNDYALIGTLKIVANSKAPSPRMANDGIMHETTFNEKHRYEHLSVDNKDHILSMLKVLLNIGLYLGGWKGGEEPYISALKPVYDTVRMELKIVPLIESLHKDPHYPLIKNFPIMGYYRRNRQVASKPSIVDNSLNVDRCLNNISLGINEDHQRMGSHLISTAYYYITTVCNTPLPMLEPLIVSLTQIPTDAI